MGIRAPNYTQLPNELFDDWLPNLGFAELKVLMVIMRKTFGWHKVRDRISLSQLEKLTGLSRRHITKAVKVLCEKGLICKFCEGKNGEQMTFYELIVIEDSNISYQCPKDTPPSVLRTPTKETTPKEKEEIPIPTKVGSDQSFVPQNRREFGTNLRALQTNPRALKTNPGKKKEKKEVARFVTVTEIQEEELLKKANGSLDLVKKWYDFLSQWKISKGVDNRPNDYSCILRWVMKAVEEDSLKPKQVNTEEVNRKFIEEILIKIPYRPEISLGPNYIEFNFGPNNRPYIKFTDSGFQEQVLNNLAKMGIFP